MSEEIGKEMENIFEEVKEPFIKMLTRILNTGRKVGRREAKEEIIEMIKEANIEYSSDYKKPLQKCEQCGHDLTPHINHEIDQFYKLIMRKLKDGDE